MNVVELDFPSDVKRVWDLDVKIIYITEDIDNPNTYNEVIHTLRNSDPTQTITLFINTDGGVLDSAISLVGAIRDSYATTVAHLSGTVASAGTIIALACDELIIDDHTKFMVHTYSTGMSGKGNEVKAQQEFMAVAIKDLLSDVYEGFLTADELDALIEGKDFWFNKEEVLFRWEKAHK